ncbi:30S ribosomal protein S12 methylthiotransferase RimO [Bacillota bacterium LX-D]|nr:30S ribosomal protein S12 methylthiotransferase RimO [Bacillota bacterium LX-D]
MAKVAVVTLGCDKNTVDSECMLGLLNQEQYHIVTNTREADIIIINTCGFITAAKEESINTILEMVNLKKIKPELKVIVTGCLVQKYCTELAEEIPEVDGFLGSNDVTALPALLDKVSAGQRITKLQKSTNNPDLYIPRVKSTEYYSYLKVAEGCDKKCTYCAIPEMRGGYASRSIASLLKETEIMAQSGIKEISLVAQDITLYGEDLYHELSLVKLLQQIAKISDLEWIRLLYCYPDHITDELINFIAAETKVCNYLDIPLQHAHPEILKQMGRRGNTEQIIKLIEKLRTKIPNVALRTTFIVGFPGETERHFQTLLDFMSLIKFDWVGVFTYSQEEGTVAAGFANQVPDEVKEERFHRAMLHQLEITSANNNKWLGKTVPVLVEGKALERDGFWQGRTEQQAPEVDGSVLFSADKVEPGEFVPVLIRRVEEYDLIGEIQNEFS